MKRLLPALLLVPLGGCVSTVAHVATAPVRIVSKGVDWATTSQSESDRNYGRKMRKQEEKRGREERKAQREARKHRDQDDYPR